LDAILNFTFGRASYIITAADLHPVTNGNGIVKFADDDTAAIDLLRITIVIRCVLCRDRGKLVIRQPM